MRNYEEPRQRCVTKISEARIEKGLVQKDVALKVGITRLAYINIENGKTTPSVKVALRIARILGTTVDKLFDEE